ncbi:MAG: hypothetical protein ACTSXE_00795 [Candidatus Thorarchaeota archaeon]
MGGGGKAPAINTAPVEEDKKKTKKIRSALYATEGGAKGIELDEGEVAKRNTYFGN